MLNRVPDLGCSVQVSFPLQITCPLSEAADFIIDGDDQVRMSGRQRTETHCSQEEDYGLGLQCSASVLLCTCHNFGQFACQRRNPMKRKDRNGSER